MNLMICGSRSITDKEWVYSQINEYLESLESEGFNKRNIIIIEGEAKGVDSLARDWATENGLQIIKCPADWATFGKSAGNIRNEAMVEMSDRCLILWDGESRGTLNDIDLCKRYDIPFKTIIKGE